MKKSQISFYLFLNASWYQISLLFLCNAMIIDQNNRGNEMKND